MLATVYFHGPATNWTCKVASGECVAEFSGPYWIVRLRARQLVKLLNRGRCGYVIQDGNETVERVEARVIDLV